MSKLTMIERPTPGCETNLAFAGSDTDGNAAFAHAGEEDAMLPTQFFDGAMTDQRPISLAGWSGAVLIGAAIWAAALVWLS